MKYKKFTIKNYKGIFNMTLDLDRKPDTNITTLVGLNESGKTSILEAIDLFQNNFSAENAHKLIPKHRQHAFTDSVEVEAEIEFSDKEINNLKDKLKNDYKFILSNPENDKIIKIKKVYSFENSLPKQGDFYKIFWTTKFIGKTNKGKNEKRLSEWNKDVWTAITSHIKDTLLPKIIYYEDFLFDFPEKIYLEAHQGEGEEQHEYREVVQDILNEVGANLSIQEHLINRMNNIEDDGSKKSLSSMLLKMAEKINVGILKEWDEIFGSQQNKTVIIDHNSDIESITNKKRHYLEIKIRQGSDDYSINDRSLGFRWFFSFLIFTAFRRARSSDHGETLFLLDEPASNLHQSSQQKLLQNIESIFSNCKLIYSTHSHNLIEPKWLSGAYIVKNEAIKYGSLEDSDVTETKISSLLYKQFVANYPNERDHFKPILDALDYAPSQLEMVPSIIFSEGKSDYYVFRYLTRVIFPKEYGALNFFPGAGVDKYGDIFRLYISWNRSFVTIFDSDKAGKSAKTKYENEIGIDMGNRIFTYEEIDKKFDDYTIESFFSDTEKLKIIQHFFPDHKKEDGFDKSKFNTSLQDMYANSIKFNLNKGTKEKFIKVLDFLISKI